METARRRAVVFAESFHSLRAGRLQGLTVSAFSLLLSRMNGKRLWFLGVLCFAIAATTQAALVFEKTELDLKPDLGATNAVAVFKYENKGDTPVHIKSVRPS